jgi:hypothetical protein
MILELTPSRGMRKITSWTEITLSNGRLLLEVSEGERP